MEKTTNYKNISWDRNRRLWRGHISQKGIRYDCGYFKEEIQAVKAVDMKIIKNGLDYKKLQILIPTKSETKNP